VHTEKNSRESKKVKCPLAKLRATAMFSTATHKKTFSSVIYCSRLDQHNRYFCSHKPATVDAKRNLVSQKKTQKDSRDYRRVKCSCWWRHDTLTAASRS